jgi:hypothetical protein
MVFVNKVVISFNERWETSASTAVAALANPGSG